MKMMNLCWRLSSLFLPIGISYPHQQKLAKAAITRRRRRIKKWRFSRSWPKPRLEQGGAIRLLWKLAKAIILNYNRVEEEEENGLVVAEDREVEGWW